jgi:hypothetical protein
MVQLDVFLVFLNLILLFLGTIYTVHSILYRVHLNTFKNDYIGYTHLLYGRMFKFSYVVKI